MGCIRVDKITEYLCDPLQRCLKVSPPPRTPPSHVAGRHPPEVIINESQKLLPDDNFSSLKRILTRIAQRLFHFFCSAQTRSEWTVSSVPKN